MAITLEAPETVHAGDAITGEVRATGRVRVFVRRTVSWRGPRVPSASVHQEQGSTIVSGDAPFTLAAVRGPLTYGGEHIELRWSVVAESQDGGRDRAEVPFVLSAPRATTYEREAAGGYRDRPTETTTLEPDLGDGHVEGERRASSDDLFAMLGTWMLRTFARIAADSGPRHITLDVMPSRVRAGDELAAKLAFVTREELVVESITIQLVAQERFGGTLEIESRVETVSDRARLAPGEHTYEARLRVPNDAPASFAIGGIGVEWFVRATIQIDGRADAVNEVVIGVAPF